MTNADIIKGKAKQAEGKAENKVGDVTGSTSDKVEGKAKIAEGKIEEGVGKVKQAVKKATS